MPQARSLARSLRSNGNRTIQVVLTVYPIVCCIMGYYAGRTGKPMWTIVLLGVLYSGLTWVALAAYRSKPDQFFTSLRFLQSGHARNVPTAMPIEGGNDDE